MILFVRPLALCCALFFFLPGCGIPTGGCNKGGGGLFEEVTVDYDCNDTSVIDSNETGDTGTDSDSDSGKDTDTAAPIDADGDGFNAGDDCNDDDAAINPDAVEICDGVDNNCDTLIDTDAVDQTTYYADDDGDGYGDASVMVSDCSAPVGYVGDSTDCDDTDSTVHPYAAEDCSATSDLNCDGSFGTADVDGDGVPACEDCDDSNAAMFPGGTEVCDGFDNDCEGTTDIDATDSLTWYEDSDSDSYGNFSVTALACTEPSGYVADDTDCDDTNTGINPGQVEVCNGADDNCSGAADEGLAFVDYFMDSDSDSYGSGTAYSACMDPGTGYSTNSTDCNDYDAGINPGAAEVCNSADDDCSGVADDGLPVTTSYQDSDSDSYGNASSTTSTCDGTAPGGYVFNFTDCNDGDSGINPGALEVCNSVDDDCDGAVDNSAVDASTWYMDGDNDGFGNASVSLDACTEPSGYTADATDCDDSDNDAYPDNPEWCDGVDNDCDGVIDLNDGDGDGVSSCDGDCDDGDATEFPGNPEVCDSKDNNCDGTVDEGVLTAYYADADTDGYGDPSVLEEACSAPAGYVADSADCDDGEPNTNPGEAEIEADGVDNDCDGVELIFQTDFGMSTGVCVLDGLVTSSGAAVLQSGGCYIWVQPDGSLTAPSVSDDVVVSGLNPGDVYTFSWDVGNAFATSTTFAGEIGGGPVSLLALGTGTTGTLAITTSVSSSSVTASLWDTGSRTDDGYLSGFTVTK